MKWRERHSLAVRGVVVVATYAGSAFSVETKWVLGVTMMVDKAAQNRNSWETMVGQFVFPVVNSLYNRRGIRPAFRRALQTEKLDPEEVAAMQLEKLRQVATHAYEKVPFYRERFDQAGLRPEDIHSREDLKVLPPLEREEVIDHHHEMVIDQYRPFVHRSDLSLRGPGEPIPWARFKKNRVVRNMSSGSTGSPVTFYEDGQRTALNWALGWRHRSWFGIQPGVREVRMARVRGLTEGRLRVPFLRKMLWSQLILLGMNLTKEDYFFCIEQLQRFKPRVLWGITSAWVGLAEFMEEHQQSLTGWNPRLLITWAAPLYEHEEELLSRVFQCEVTNNYGSREVGHIAVRCPEGRYHIHDDHVLVEVDESTCQEPGEPGQILCTTLDNTVMPFIRYRIGDLGKVSHSSCSCGRPLRELDQLLGRTGDIFRTSDGRMIAPNLWCRLFMNPELESSVRRFQVVYERSGSIRFRVVRGINYDDSKELMLIQQLRELVGTATGTSFDYVDSIEPHVSGKLLMVVREVPE